MTVGAAATLARCPAELAAFDERVVEPASVEGLPLALAGVVKRFGARTVLDGIDLVIPAGQFVALVGRSGGGKTTLLRLLAGLSAVSDGSIQIGGSRGAGRHTP